MIACTPSPAPPIPTPQPPSPTTAPATSPDDRYDPVEHLLRSQWHSPGYHTAIPDCTTVHETRASLAYALDLLRSNHPERYPRAADIIRRILSLQDTDRSSKTLGIWPWLLEEPLPKMAAPDYNWADFLGAMEAEILIDHSDKLPTDIVTDLRTSLRLATHAIITRDIHLDYTNIAVMDCAVTAAAGEILPEPSYVDYARTKLHRFVEFTHHNGGFSEYSSPTYTLVALGEADRILHLIQDPHLRTDAEEVRLIAWQTIADHFHPGTQQWAGPQSRAYSDKLTPSTLQYLADQTHLPLGGLAPTTSHDWHLPCPPSLIPRFQKLPQDPLTVLSTFLQAPTEAATLRGTTWFTADATLGSINHSNFWTQSRPVLAYWKTPADPAVVLRLRFLHDDRDFASAYATHIQTGPRILSAISLMPNLGDFHPSLDKPADQTFSAQDFRIRYELTGHNLTAKSLPDGSYELIAAPWKALIHPAPASTDADAHTMPWQLRTDANHITLDGIYYHGPSRKFPIKSPTPTFATITLELLPQK